MFRALQIIKKETVESGGGGGGSHLYNTFIQFTQTSTYNTNQWYSANIGVIPGVREFTVLNNSVITVRPSATTMAFLVGNNNNFDFKIVVNLDNTFTLYWRFISYYANEFTLHINISNYEY